MPSDLGMLGHGLYFDDVEVGMTFRTIRRTITEADLVAFVNLTWLTEELFVNVANRESMAIKGRVVPAALVYAFAEGLMTPMMQHTGLAFLHAEVDVKGPTFVGDTMRIEVEVIEARRASRGNRGLVRTRNQVTMQDGRVTLVYTPLRLLMGR